MTRDFGAVQTKAPAKKGAAVGYPLLQLNVKLALFGMSSLGEHCIARAVLISLIVFTRSHCYAIVVVVVVVVFIVAVFPRRWFCENRHVGSALG